jgi:hypothetical protein
MPAGSEALVPLPHRFRPLGVRLAVALCGGLLLVVVLTIWFSFSADIRSQFTDAQLVTVVGLGALAGVAGYALARCRVDAREGGISVVNGYRRRELEWTEILAVSLRPGSPWAVLDLSDGTAVPAMGIQGSDGARAQRQVRQLRALVDAHSQTPRDD